MSSDSGARKRNVPIKKKKGSAGSINPGGITIREIPLSKPNADELIHVQKDVQFGDNWCKVAVFFVISSALVGVAYCVFLGNNSGKQSESQAFDWLPSLPSLPSFDFFSNNELPHDPVVLPEEPVEPEAEEPNEEPQSGNIDRVANEADAVLVDAGGDYGDLADIAQSIADNLLDSMNNDSNSYNRPSEAENRTLQDYLETPSNSATEQSEDESANEPANEGSIPMDSEKSQTASETESETDDDSEYGKGDYDRMNITNRADWQYRHQLDEADDDWDREDFQL